MNLTLLAQWEAGIYQLEQTDLVLGGPPTSGGVSNVQAQLLGNRTEYLYDVRGRFESVVSVSVSGTVTPTAIQLRTNHLDLSPDVNGGTVLLNNASTLPDGAIVSISISGLSATWGRWVKITLNAGMNFQYRGGGFWDNFNIYLYSGETALFVKSGARLIMLNTESNVYQVGDIQHSFKPPIMSVAAQGQLLQRSAYPRLWAWLQVSGGGAVISEATYGSNVLNYSGCFTSGNGTTTFRVPDLRSVFIRGLDSGRGLDIGRPYNAEGGYEADDFKAHAHTSSGVVGQDIPEWDHNAGSGTNLYQGTVTSSSVGGAETRPKNVGYTAYIKY